MQHAICKNEKNLRGYNILQWISTRDYCCFYKPKIKYLNVCFRFFPIKNLKYL